MPILTIKKPGNRAENGFVELDPRSEKSCVVNYALLPLPASEFVTRHEYQSMLKKIDANTTLILGHTRQSTKGDPAFPRNNHPLRARAVIGVHNGHINNDDELFARYHYPRKAHVDSEIIFRMLEQPCRRASGDAISGRHPAILAIARWTVHFPGLRSKDALERLLVLKHENPLYYLYKREWNAIGLFFAIFFLRKAFGNGLTPEALPHDRLLLFDADALSQTGNPPVASLQLYKDEKQYGK